MHQERQVKPNDTLRLSLVEKYIKKNESDFKDIDVRAYTFHNNLSRQNLNEDELEAKLSKNEKISELEDEDWEVTDNKPLCMIIHQNNHYVTVGIKKVPSINNYDVVFHDSNSILFLENGRFHESSRITHSLNKDALHLVNTALIQNESDHGFRDESLALFNNLKDYKNNVDDKKNSSKEKKNKIKQYIAQKLGVNVDKLNVVDISKQYQGANKCLDCSLLFAKNVWSWLSDDKSEYNYPDEDLQSAIRVELLKLRQAAQASLPASTSGSSTLPDQDPVSASESSKDRKDTVTEVKAQDSEAQDSEAKGPAGVHPAALEAQVSAAKGPSGVVHPAALKVSESYEDLSKQCKNFSLDNKDVEGSYKQSLEFWALMSEAEQQYGVENKGVSAKQTEVQDLQQEVQDLAGNISSKQTEVQALQQEVGNLAGDVSAKQTEVQASESKVQDLEQGVSDKQTAVKSLAEKLRDKIKYPNSDSYLYAKMTIIENYILEDGELNFKHSGSRNQEKVSDREFSSDIYIIKPLIKVCEYIIKPLIKLCEYISTSVMSSSNLEIMLETLLADSEAKHGEAGSEAKHGEADNEAQLQPLSANIKRLEKECEKLQGCVDSFSQPSGLQSETKTQESNLDENDTNLVNAITLSEDLGVEAFSQILNLYNIAKDKNKQAKDFNKTLKSMVKFRNDGGIPEYKKLLSKNRNFINEVRVKLSSDFFGSVTNSWSNKDATKTYLEKLLINLTLKFKENIGHINSVRSNAEALKEKCQELQGLNSSLISQRENLAQKQQALKNAKQEVVTSIKALKSNYVILVDKREELEALKAAQALAQGSDSTSALAKESDLPLASGPATQASSEESGSPLALVQGAGSSVKFNWFDVLLEGFNKKKVVAKASASGSTQMLDFLEVFGIVPDSIHQSSYYIFKNDSFSAKALSFNRTIAHFFSMNNVFGLGKNVIDVSEKDNQYAFLTYSIIALLSIVLFPYISPLIGGLYFALAISVLAVIAAAIIEYKFHKDEIKTKGFFVKFLRYLLFAPIKYLLSFIGFVFWLAVIIAVKAVVFVFNIIVYLLLTVMSPLLKLISNSELKVFSKNALTDKNDFSYVLHALVILASISLLVVLIFVPNALVLLGGASVVGGVFAALFYLSLVALINCEDNLTFNCLSMVLVGLVLSAGLYFAGIVTLPIAGIIAGAVVFLGLTVLIKKNWQSVKSNLLKVKGFLVNKKAEIGFGLICLAGLAVSLVLAFVPSSIALLGGALGVGIIYGVLFLLLLVICAFGDIQDQVYYPGKSLEVLWHRGFFLVFLVSFAASFFVLGVFTMTVFPGVFCGTIGLSALGAPLLAGVSKFIAEVIILLVQLHPLRSTALVVVAIGIPVAVVFGTTALVVMLVACCVGLFWFGIMIERQHDTDSFRAEDAVSSDNLQSSDKVLTKRHRLVNRLEKLFNDFDLENYM